MGLFASGAGYARLYGCWSISSGYHSTAAANGHMWPAKSRVGLGSAPARQIFRLFASREPQRSLHGGGEIRFDSLSFDLPAEKIRPQKLAERGRVLRETTRPRQFAGEAAERIVLQMHDSLWNVRKIPPAATWVEGINHVFVSKEGPKRVR